jgi:hypothetical protein
MIYGYFVRTQDLHMMDQMVFAVRRLMLTQSKLIGCTGAGAWRNARQHRLICGSAF